MTVDARDVVVHGTEPRIDFCRDGDKDRFKLNVTCEMLR
jgi:hypothetical protein